MRASRLDHWHPWLFLLTIAWGAGIFWIAPHPPLIDLPQHAGQIALLRDLMQGSSPWHDLFRTNLLTPYLLGYGLALPLTLVMPVAAALKLLLTLAFLAFVLLCIRLRRQFGADTRLDWLFIPGFFGFAYNWGFFTFLLAAPVALWFVLLAERYTHYQTPGRKAGLVAVGLALLASHGLAFLFAWMIGAAMLAPRLRRTKIILRAALPYAVLLLACAAYFLVNRHLNAGMQADLTALTSWNGGPQRLGKIAVYTLTHYASGIGIVLWAGATLLLLAAPWLLGLRIDWRLTASWVTLAILLAIFLLVPSNAMSTVYLYQRFALFLLPAYAWMFTRTPTGPPRTHSAQLARTIAVPLLMLVCWAVLAMHTWRTASFAVESAPIDNFIARLQPGQRALMLMFDPDSPAAGWRVYTHYPAWYQAEKHGLVDFNFAWFPPQIVRFRPDKLPAVQPGFEWHPERFDWGQHKGELYRYFFVRSDEPLPQGLFRGEACAPRLIWEQGEWQVFENLGCG